MNAIEIDHNFAPTGLQTLKTIKKLSINVQSCFDALLIGIKLMLNFEMALKSNDLEFKKYMS